MSTSVFLLTAFVAFLLANGFVLSPPNNRHCSKSDLFALFGGPSENKHSDLSEVLLDAEEFNSSPDRTNEDKNDSIQWEVYVDQSKASLDNGASATLDAFLGLAPPSVKVIPAVLPRLKTKPPVVRCIAVDEQDTSFDVANVDSADKIFRILTKHMKLTNVDPKACDSLKWKYKGNGHTK